LKIPAGKVSRSEKSIRQIATQKTIDITYKTLYHPLSYIVEGMMLAVIKTGGKQYKVEEGNIIDVELVGAEGAKSFTFDEVLLVSDNGSVKVGTPTVAGAKVEAEIVGEVRGEKVLVFKRKPRKDYRKRIGHRQSYTRVKITKIVG
jgi:large subunit ribosomal protein L21